jgi:hypothetical protein
MANDPSLALRQQIVARLKASPAVTDLVVPSRIHGERSPANPIFPFIRYGQADVRPRRASCWDGAEVDLPLHAFSQSPSTDQVANINAQVAAALDGAVLDLGGDLKAHLAWTGSQIIPDAEEATVWHGIQRFTATIAG